MPNHCTNNLSCTSGKTIGEILKPFISERTDRHGTEQFLDFNKIVPMPQCILDSIKFGSIESITEKRTPEEEEVHKAEQKANEELCLEQTGHKNWYDWSVANWDTKWNSYSNWSIEGGFNELEDLSIYGFQTAWSPPINVIRHLAKLTGESLRMSYYDEGWMFAGEYLVDPDGSEVDNCYDDMDNIPEGSDLWEECDLGNFYDLRDNEE